MKLFTEEQVRTLLSEHISNYWIDKYLSNITPIKLPSDEEIEKEINSDIHIESDAEFFNGAKWVIEQIKQQDNG